MSIGLEGRRRRRRGGASIKAVDETAASDAFRAAFAVALAEGLDERTALRHAAAARAAVTRGGRAALSTFSRGRDACYLPCPTCPVAAASAGGGLCGEAATVPLAFASRLNSMKDRRDLAEGLQRSFRMGEKAGDHRRFEWFQLPGAPRRFEVEGSRRHRTRH